MKVTSEIERLRKQWHYVGETRPAAAREPGPGQESVWDYPRPPRIESDSRLLRVVSGECVIAQSTRAKRVLETASPPTFYVPPSDVRLDALIENGSRSVCEWKGVAVGLDLRDGPANVAWSYPDPFPEFEPIAGWIAFYPARIECFLGEERVRPQPGGYYGGWITHEIVGPVKGEPGCDGL